MPIPLALAAAGVQAAGSVAGGFLANKGAGRQTQLEKKKGKLVDQLLASLNGNGPYKDLFNADDATFQKSFVEPAKSMFSNQIAPQIQQQYIASGQQRGTGLDDQLLRAGVDLDQLLNSSMYQFQNDAKNRQSNVISNILGQSNGTQPGFTTGQALAQGTAGYLSGDSFKDTVTDIFKAPPAQENKQNQPNRYNLPNFGEQPRAGFAPDYRQWRNAGVGDPIWGRGY